MSQRIDAIRSVFSVNLKSSIADKPGSGFAQPQSRQPGRVHLRAVTLPEPEVKHTARTKVISPPPDRRMFRRRVEHPVLQPAGMSRQAFQTSDPKSSALVNDPAVDHVPSFLPESKPMEQVPVPVIEHEAIMVRPHVQEDTIPEYEEYDETYVIDRPVFLLSQKYFGTRY